jgi:hypothetical protein
MVDSGDMAVDASTILYETSTHEQKVVGRNYLWHIARARDGSTGELVATPFTQQRAKNARGNTEHTVFIRCRSFQEVSKDGGAGYAVAFSVDKQKSWKLGIMAYNHPDLLSHNKVLIFEWNGQLAPSEEKGPAVPDYCSAGIDSWKKHFHLKVIRVEERAVWGHFNICFLNQVSGPRPSQSKLTAGLMNKEDGCYQSSPKCPDFLFPGFKCFVTLETRNQLLGCTPCQPPCQPANKPVRSKKGNKRKRNTFKHADASSAIVSRRVHPYRSLDGRDQPVYFVQDGADRMKGATVTVDPPRTKGPTTSGHPIHRVP